MSYEIINVEQGTDEWFNTRLGKVTASIFSKVVTKAGKPSASMEGVINNAVAEMILGKPQDEMFQSYYMQRGNELEGEALDLFNFCTDSEFQKVGFLDSGKGYGCSPDGLNEKIKQGLELKCPAAHTHVGYLSGGGLPKDYFQQVQFSLIVSGFEYWSFGSYHPDLPVFIHKEPRDEKFIKLAMPILDECVGLIKERYEKIKALM